MCRVGGRASDAVHRGEDQESGYGGVSSVPLGGGDRRHVGGDVSEDGEAGLGEVPGQPAHERERAGPRVPRPGDGADDPGDDAEDGHRRAVRREVLLSRRARDPNAAVGKAGGAETQPRRLVSRGNRRVVLGGPAVLGEDHGGGTVRGAAGAQPEPLP